jgi:hypothetical protein
LSIVAGIIGGSLAIFSGPLASFPIAQAILIGLLVIGVGIGATAGIVRRSESTGRWTNADSIP